MNEHVAKQNQLRRLILRALDNFKKIGKTNLTPAKVRSRISSLKDSWSRFLDGHATLCKVVPEASQASLDYFRDELFDDTEEAFQSALDFMAESLEELEPPVSPNSSLGQSPIRLPPPGGMGGITFIMFFKNIEQVFFISQSNDHFWRIAENIIFCDYSAIYHESKKEFRTKFTYFVA
ncbi:hypothetical protein EAI_17613 [Harpegnathos saltator]|uniref:Uncharacterized protein n=1 Tax=Harpegnathos saltator TaxID=610380 RepID=E2BNM4_HARSA|nr:hypothetical protein EAI_17613 [Harpegnathos saltator]